MAKDFEEIRNRVKKGVKDFIDAIDWSEYDDPEERLIKANTDGKITGSVSLLRPSLVLSREDLYGELRNSREDYTLNKVSNWLYESGNGFEINFEDDEGNKVENPDKNNVRSWYESELVKLVGAVLDYAGKFEFDEEAFERAFEKEFLEGNYKSTTYQEIVLLTNFSGPAEPVELTTDVDIPIDEDLEIEKIEISPLTEEEISAIYTHEQKFFEIGFGGGGFGPFNKPEYKILVESNYSEGFHGDSGRLINYIAKAMRLYKPESGGVGTAGDYTLVKNWKYYREGFPRVKSASSREDDTKGSRKDYLLESDEIPDFKEFWRKNAKYIAQPPDNTSIALKRFNQMYKDSEAEDAIIDAAIGFESTLVKDMPPTTESINYRLRTRAPILIASRCKEDRGQIREFFKEIYNVRSKIIHEGKSMKSLLNSSEFESTEFKHKTRKYLRDVVLEYWQLIEKYSSIDEVNKEIDNAMLHTEIDKL